MKKIIRFSFLMLLTMLFASLPFFAQKTDYQIGESEGGLLNDGKLKEAFEKAADKFKEWMYEGMPSGYVTQTDDYYMQTFTDGEDRGAAVYVGPDYTPYVFRGPIYEQLESVGGMNALGRPVSDAYQVNGVWYQNFDNGYATVGSDGKASFVRGQRVDEQGTVSSATDSTSSDSVTDSSGRGTNDTTDSMTDTSMPSPSEMVSDVVSDVEEGTSRWGMWVFVVLILLAAVILIIYWFLKRR